MINHQNWHHRDIGAIFIKLATSEEGLTSLDVQNRMLQFGENLIEKVKVNALWSFIYHQFTNPLVLALLAATGLTIFLGDIRDALVVLSVVIFNAVIGFFQEYRAHKTIEALQQMVPEKTIVIRQGQKQEINPQFVVPGDIVFLQSGDRVPSDLRVVYSAGLRCDESMLTGESVPVDKVDCVLDEKIELADRCNMVFKGTIVTFGSGIGVTVATGMNTELGKISRMLEEVPSIQTPLTRSLSKLSAWITGGIGVVTGIILFVAWLRGVDFFDAIMSSVALAVASIPEGLPVVVTVSAAIGVQRMAHKKAIIRQLPAVEALGSVSVICTDKTGTLTKNEMTLQKIWTGSGHAVFSGVGYTSKGEVELSSPSILKEAISLFQASILCCDASIKQEEGSEHPIGDPTEIAILYAFRKLGRDEEEIIKPWDRISEIPFSSEHKFMMTLCSSKEERKVFMKGAPEAVFKACGIKDDLRRIYENAVEEMAKEGLRVLAVASKNTSLVSLTAGEHDGFEFMGLLGFIDPARLEVKDAIGSCMSAGIDVKMITGDHPLTAGSIAQQIQLKGDGRVFSGHQLDQMSEKELSYAVGSSNVFARVSPENKLQIVSSLQKMGHVVAMTGDGVNDAPALQKADIGVAMGIKGTAIAKEAADMVLVDDNFVSIVAAVEEGRRVYDNLVKAILFILTTSFGQAFIVVISVLFFPLSEGKVLHPILPIQILWINLIVAAGLAVPLAFEPVEADIMQKPPRPRNQPLLSSAIAIKIFISALLMALGAVSLYVFILNNYISGESSLSLIESKGQTIAITALVLVQCWYLIDCRSSKDVFKCLKIFQNRYVPIGLVGVLTLQALFVYAPFMNQIFGSVPLNLQECSLAFSVSVIFYAILALLKWIFGRIFL